MCLDDLNILGGRTINDSTELLKKFQEAAKSEGDDIIKNLLPKNSCNADVICDAMKYSFADLADIIRGRDLWNKNRKERNLQTRLEYAFIKIYNNLEKDKRKYEKDRPKYLQLRSDWWDANRRDIWKAMTCNAPDDAKLLKKNEIGNNTTSSKVNCGHNTEPPDYDYIPQPFRWMQEWSETFCKLLNKELENFKNECKDCKNNGIMCQNNENGTKCEKCKTQCEKYKQLIDKWKLQFDKYIEAYKEIYNNKSKISSEVYVNKFLEKLKTQCNGIDSADKYLDEASHCTKYKFTNHSGSNNNDDNYAFKNPPKQYKGICECEPPDPLDQCPKNDQHLTVCKNFSPTKLYQNKTFNNDIDIWTSQFIQKSPGNYTGVLVPPRRRQICLKNITTKLRSIEKIMISKPNL
ncbi:hypothetical protein PFHG_05355 [Plasmodium falciparum HB3]|uniref:Plasmodium falciparum erythrocyte membrane protein 1 acidic terminal segment domain-containing protein n=1 Tax=Plasmodium falciparum (isolate HB3) TaxID=137071 RepID=A0A0L7KK10_PLAFX|nr:hypothetical protein PFHG_05355 [Plasmodium falciparum HB3]